MRETRERIGRVGVAAAWALCGAVAGSGGIGGCGRKAPPFAEGAERTWVGPDQPVFEMGARPTTRPAPPVEPVLLEEPERIDEQTKQVIEAAKGTLIYTPRHSRPETLRDAVEGIISPEGSVSANPALNNLIVADRLDYARQVLKVLEEIDRPTSQLLVEARVVEVTLDNDLEYELRHFLNLASGERSDFFRDSDVTLRDPGTRDLANPGININVRPWASDSGTLDTFLRLLVTRGKAKILSSPNLLVTPGNEASIITGQEVPVISSQVVGGSVSTNTQFKRVGIKLRVLLQQISGETARLEVNPEVSTVLRFTEAQENIPPNPVIAIRNVTSTLTMKDGEVLTVGGLLQDEDRTTIRGIPGLMDLPGVGILFQSRRHQTVKTQLIFFLRIHVLGEGQAHTTRVHKPGSSLEQMEFKTNLILPEERRKEPPKKIESEAGTPTPAGAGSE